jgi:predicted transcriptional regulator
MPDAASNLVELAGDIVSAYVAKNSVQVADLPKLIESVHSALKDTAEGKPKPEPLTPPVPINRTIHGDYIISLEDGKKYKSMRRHLSSRGMTPEQYRMKWGLRPDYPMVAPNYSKARSELAKALGLGQGRKGAKKGARKRAAA